MVPFVGFRIKKIEPSNEEYRVGNRAYGGYMHELVSSDHSMTHVTCVMWWLARAKERQERLSI
jgi:hypothetical protein